MHKKILQFFALLLGLLTSVAFTARLPDLSSHSRNAITIKQEQQLGQQFMHEVRRSIPLIHDPLLNHYLNNLGNQLAAQSSTNNKHFKFFIVANPQINAFSGPGNQIGVFAGLILATQTESQLAAVLAHEITHATQQHILRSINEAKNLNLANTAAIFAAILIGASSKNANLSSGIASAAVAGSSQHMLTFSRSFEKEADRIGMQLLCDAGFDPRAMPAFFLRMQKSNLSYGEQFPEYLRTHPLDAERIADTSNRAAQYDIDHPIPSSPEYLLLRARLRVMSALTSQTATKYYKNQNQKLPANQYGYTLALLRDKQFKAASTIITKLIKRDPQQIIYAMTQAEILTAENRIATATQLLRHEHALYPDFYPLSYQYARTLIDNRQPKTAIKLIKQQLREYPNNINFYDLLAYSQGKAGNLTEAYQARAKVFELLGSKHQAIVQLQQALKQPKLDNNTKAVLKTKIRMLQNKP